MILAIFPYFFVKNPQFRTTNLKFFDRKLPKVVFLYPTPESRAPASNYEKKLKKTWQVYKLF
jgi:hypothetical protein